MHIYHVLINALSAHVIHINLNNYDILYTCRNVRRKRQKIIAFVEVVVVMAVLLLLLLLLLLIESRITTQQHL